jgi:hypothetical protein
MAAIQQRVAQCNEIVARRIAVLDALLDSDSAPERG